MYLNQGQTSYVLLLLFHLNELKAKTFTSVELKKALELGYRITKIYRAIQYERHGV
jgi:hypothetical protein